MEEPRFSMGTVAYGGLIYLVGGCTHTRRHMQELVSYNPVRYCMSLAIKIAQQETNVSIRIVESYRHIPTIKIDITGHK